MYVDGTLGLHGGEYEDSCLLGCREKLVFKSLKLI